MVSRFDFYEADATGATSGKTKIASVNGNSQASGTFSATWQGAPVGSYTLTATVTDSFGLTATSAPVHITVTAHSLAPTPVISPQSGSYPGFVQVTITDAAPSATIYYTIDGSTPGSGNASSLHYTGAFTLYGSASVKARAFASSLDPSAVAEQDYTITQGDIYNGDGTLTAAITSPGDGGQVTQPTTVSALITRSGVSSSKSVAWSFYTRLSGAAASNDPWIPIGSGTIVGGSGDPTTVTAQFDPTLRINGLCGVTVARGGGIGLL